MTDHPGDRRPPPSTGRQDRHRPPTPPTRASGQETLAPDQDALPPEPPAEHLPPRGMDYYNHDRGRELGVGCLVFLVVACFAIAIILVVIGFMPMGDETMPAGVAAPGAAPTDSASAPPPDAGGGGDGAGTGAGGAME